MKLFAKIFLPLLLIVNSCYSQNGFPRQLTDTIFAVTVTQLTNANLTADSLDECKEITDSLQVQVNNALRVIQTDVMLQQNLNLQIENYKAQVGEKDVQIKYEQNISSQYRNKFRLWKVLTIVLAGLNIYQIVK